MFERGTSPDVVEGVASFLEQRPARFGQTVPADLPDVFADLPGTPDAGVDGRLSPGTERRSSARLRNAGCCDSIPRIQDNHYHSLLDRQVCCCGRLDVGLKPARPS